MTDVNVVIGAGSIGQAVARRVMPASISFWRTFAKKTRRPQRRR